MFDFFNGLSGGLTSILPTFAGLTQGAGNLFSGFLGDSPMGKPKTPMMMPNIQQPGGNFLLDNMTPEVAGVFQGMGVNPEGFAMQPTQQGQQGLLNQGSVNIQAPQAPVFNAPQMPVYNQRQQITPVDLQQYYRNLMSSRQGIL
tara:strand:- start:1392 stop:1823 length:432 start_codon:yes stop_codon:yes gene_type:complete